MEKQKQQEYAEKAEKEKKKKQNALIQSLFKTVVDIQKTEDGASKFSWRVYNHTLLQSITKKHCVVTSKQEFVKKGKSANTVMISRQVRLRKQILIFTLIQEQRLEKCQTQSSHANISLLPQKLVCTVSIGSVQIKVTIVSIDTCFLKAMCFRKKIRKKMGNNHLMRRRN